MKENKVNLLVLQQLYRLIIEVSIILRFRCSLCLFETGYHSCNHSKHCGTVGGFIDR